VRLAAIILMLLMVTLFFGCNDQEGQKAWVQENTLEREIQVVRDKYRNNGETNYITVDETNKIFRNRGSDICRVFVGKTFVASSKDTIYNNFHNKIHGLHDSFRVRTPEKFTVVRFIDEGPLNRWFEVRFESGKQAFVDTMYFEYVTNPSVKVPLK